MMSENLTEPYFYFGKFRVATNKDNASMRIKDVETGYYVELNSEEIDSLTTCLSESLEPLIHEIKSFEMDVKEKKAQAVLI